MDHSNGLKAFNTAGTNMPKVEPARLPDASFLFRTCVASPITICSRPVFGMSKAFRLRATDYRATSEFERALADDTKASVLEDGKKSV